MKTNKRFIIAPHVDDDVLGCGGTMGPGDLVYYVGVDDFHVVSAEERGKEADAVAKAARSWYDWPREGRGLKVNRYSLYPMPLISDLESVINAEKPQEVTLPWPSYNQDHRAVYDAAMVALRPHDNNWFVPRVTLYEEPEDFWPHAGAGQFVPTLYREIDIEWKLQLYNLMPSQVRGHRSPEMVRALAAVRGAAIMKPFAEAYHIVRWVE